MITCKQACDSASDYIEGPATVWRRALLYCHLVICKHCRLFYQQFKIAIGVSAGVGSPLDMPSDTDIDAILQRLKT